MSAIERAIAADPENAYSRYLKASILAKTDLAAALKEIEEANAMGRVIIYVYAPPPEDPMQTLSRLRQLGFTADRAEALGDLQPRYFRALRTMGKRVAKAEPVSALPALNGAAIARKSLQAETAYWTKAKDKDKAASAAKALKEFEAWYGKFSELLASSLKDLMREAAKAANLTPDEAERYARGQDLEDKGKQSKADDARRKMYEAEVQAIRKGLESMPESEFGGGGEN